MTSYWLSFRLHKSDGWEDTYDERLADLTAEIQAASGEFEKDWWLSTTSFFIFNSAETLDVLVYRVRRAIAESVDLVVIGMNDFKGGRVVGQCPDLDIFTLIPEIEKA